MMSTVEKNSTLTAAEPGGHTLLPLLRAHLPALAPGPAKVATRILDDPPAAVPMTIGQLATHAGTSEASVIRLAKAVGCKGFRDFRTALTAATARNDTPHGASGLPADITVDAPPAAVIDILLAEEQRTLADTAAAVNLHALTSAADAIVSARRTIVIGIGASGLAALDLSAKLERTGLISQSVTEGHTAMTLAGLMTQQDLLIAVSSSGETTDVVEPLRVARGNGVRTVAITLRPHSSITIADHSLIGVAGRESGMRPAAMSSRTSQLFLVDALFTLVFQRRAEESAAAISTSHRHLEPRRPSRKAP